MNSQEEKNIEGLDASSRSQSEALSSGFGLEGYICVLAAARKLMLSPRCIQALCELGGLGPCVLKGSEWFIPSSVTAPKAKVLASASLKLKCEGSWKDEVLVSGESLASTLSITIDTCKNWIRLGKIKPEFTYAGVAFFSVGYIKALSKSLKNGSNTALKSRRNKKYVSGNSLYRSYVSDACVNVGTVHEVLGLLSLMELSTEEASIVTNYLISECAIAELTDRLLVKTKKRCSFLEQYLIGDIRLDKYAELIDPFIGNSKEALAFCRSHGELFAFDYVYEDKEDVLGLIYISCRSMGERKSEGAYYTPTNVVRELISELDIKPQKTIIDPCCGTGNFLIQLPSDVTFEYIYGNELDETSARITRINLALRFPEEAVLDICKHVTVCNFLTETLPSLDSCSTRLTSSTSPISSTSAKSLTSPIYSACENIVKAKKGFDYVIGNPPWGFEFSKEEGVKLKELYSVAVGRAIESYDVFTEKAISVLCLGGKLAFVLPEAILNVKLHAPIRNLILKSCSITKLNYLGDVFDGVQCPSIIMELLYNNKPFSTKGMEVKQKDECFTINTERKLSGVCFSFTLNDTDYEIIEKLRYAAGVNTSAANLGTANTTVTNTTLSLGSGTDTGAGIGIGADIGSSAYVDVDTVTVTDIGNRCYLKDQADFALGIVTGNNKEYLKPQKTEHNEVILKGSDIIKYRLKEAHNFITFEPKKFQQVAPVELYRAKEKLLYRFISNQLVFAYDNNGTLSLNSCNILIPRVKNLSTKYILAVLNSRMAQFIFQKEFNSVKVLRSHIENLPIPIASKEDQQEIEALVDKLIGVSDKGVNETKNGVVEILTPEVQVNVLVSGEDEKLTDAEVVEAFEKIDVAIACLFGLTAREYEYIKSVVGQVTKNLC